MKNFTFPIFKTKIDGISTVFKLEDPIERKKYFELKAKDEIEKLRKYLKENTFVAFLVGPKNSGKGTYSKLFTEAIGEEYIRHISVGDVVRNVHKEFSDETKKTEIVNFLKKKYRGPMALDEAIDALLGRNTKTLLPTEFTLSLVEREIELSGKKSLFIDGFPRSLDQIPYFLCFKALIGYRDNPDILIFIDLPESVIDERMKYRVICPKCQTPRSIKLLKTKRVGYDADSKQFYLICDNPECGDAKMVGKEGDELGIEAIRDRIEEDRKVTETLLKIDGISKIYLRNAIPEFNGKECVDEYEITPSYKYEYNENEKTVKTSEEPWIIKDEEGTPSYSLMPPAVVVSLIKQMAQILNL